MTYYWYFHSSSKSMSSVDLTSFLPGVDSTGQSLHLEGLEKGFDNLYFALTEFDHLVKLNACDE